MLRIFEDLSITVRAAVAPGDDQILISSSDALKLNQMAVGDHIYLTFNDARAYEVVRYNHTGAVSTPPGTVHITVDRAQHGTTRRAWPIKSCIHTSRSELAQREFICQTIQECA